MALTINLPEHIRTYIRRQVEEGRFATEDAVIAEAVEHLMDEYRWEDDEALVEAIAEVDRGEAVPWTPELLQQISREAYAAALRGDPVPDDLKY